MDEIIALYEEAEELSKQGKLQEAAQKYAAAFDHVQRNPSADNKSRAQIFATRLGNIFIKLKQRGQAKRYFDFVGLPTPPVRTELLPLDEAIKVSQKNGLLSELTDGETKSIQSKLRKKGLHNDIVNFLCEYYRNARQPKQPSDRALKEGFMSFRWSWGHEVKDVSADLAWLSKLTGDPQLLQQVKYTDEILTLENATGRQWQIRVESVDAIITQFNRTLQQQNDDRSFVRLSADNNAYLLVDQTKFDSLFCTAPPALPSDFSSADWQEYRANASSWFKSFDV